MAPKKISHLLCVAAPPRLCVEPERRSWGAPASRGCVRASRPNARAHQLLLGWAAQIRRGRGFRRDAENDTPEACPPQHPNAALVSTSEFGLKVMALTRLRANRGRLKAGGGLVDGYTPKRCDNRALPGANQVVAGGGGHLNRGYSTKKCDKSVLQGVNRVFSEGNRHLAGVRPSSGRGPTVIWRGSDRRLAGVRPSSGRGPTVVWQGSDHRLAGVRPSSGRGPTVIWQEPDCHLAGGGLASGGGCARPAASPPWSATTNNRRKHLSPAVWGHKVAAHEHDEPKLLPVEHHVTAADSYLFTLAGPVRQPDGRG